MFVLDLTEDIKHDIDGMSLEDLKTTILVEMNQRPAFTSTVCEYLLQTYTDKLAELYY